jgi:ATP:ADP antiporter, AAA family
MKKFLMKLLNIEPEDYGSVMLLLAKTFFMGIFIATYDVGTSSIFLDEKSGWTSGDLPKAFMATGGLGIIFASLFASLQSKISFSKLSVFNLLAITLIAFFVRIGLQVSHDKYIILFAFICNVPLNVVLMLGFWGLLGRMFNIRKAKDVEEVLDTGQILATIFAFFMVPVLIEFFISIGFRGNENLLSISAGSILIVLLLEVFLVNKYGKEMSQKVKVNVADTNQSSYLTLFKSRYFNLMALFMLASVIVVYCLEYSFLNALTEKFTERDESTNMPIIDMATLKPKINGELLGQFLGFFGAAIMVGTILIQKLVYDRLISMYGLKLGLVILPALLGIFTLLSAFMGNMGGETGIVLFFLAIALSKFFAASLRDAVEDPSFKMLFQPLDSRIRFDVQAKVEGVLNQFAMIVGGGILLGVSLFQLDLVYFTYLLFFILISYAYVAIKVYNEYRSTLKKTLTDQKNSAPVKSEYSISKVLDNQLLSEGTDTIIYTLKVMEKAEPLMLEASSIKMVYNASPEVRKYALEKILQLKPVDAITPVSNCLKIENKPEVRELALKALEQLSQDEAANLPKERLQAMARSRNPQDREAVAKMLAKSINDDNSFILLDLLKDLDPKVRAEAFFTAAKTKRFEYYHLLIENLASPTYSNAATSALFSVGRGIFPVLESAFYKTGQSIKTMVRIIQIYGRIGGDEAIQLLWNKIDYPDKRIISQVLLALSQGGFQAKDDKIVRIKRAIESDIGNTAWNIAALTELGNDASSQDLRNALIEENQHNHDHIYMLLSLIYEAHSIQLVRSNIESGTIEGITFAIELLNVFIDDDLKPLLFPLLDDMPDDEKIKRLQIHFPREKLNELEVLKYIINRDYNYINRYTKALAICKFAVIPEVKITDDLIANLFNPDQLLRETAAWAIYHINKEAYHTHTNRINKSTKIELDRVILGGGGDEDMGFWKIAFLKKIELFSSIPGVVLADLAESFEEVSYRKGSTLIEKGDNGNTPIYVIVKGSASFEEHGNPIVLKEGDMFGVTYVLETDVYPFSVITQEDSLLYRIEKDKFYDFMSNYYEMAQGVIHTISRKYNPVKEEEAIEI